MRAVGLRTLKNKLAEYVRLAATGEVVLVTDRERVVAELGPPSPGRADRLADAAIAALVRDGVMVPPLAVSAEPPPRRPVAPARELLAELDHDRADR